MSLASEQKTQMENAILDMIVCGMAEPRMVIIGCGGAGINIVGRMGGHFRGVPRIAVNTDLNGLMLSEADRKICIGKSITFNMDSGGFTEVALKCAELAQDDLRSCLISKDVVFIVAGYGGGTGTGVAPYIAEMARDLGMVPFGIVVLPFSAETARREKAEEQAEELRKVTESTITLDNDSLLKFGEIGLDAAFRVMDRMVVEIIRGITETMSRSYLSTLADEIIAFQSGATTAQFDNSHNHIPEGTAVADSSLPPLAFPQPSDQNLIESGGVFERF